MIGKIYLKSLIPKHSRTSYTIMMANDYFIHGLRELFMPYFCYMLTSHKSAISLATFSKCAFAYIKINITITYVKAVLIYRSKKVFSFVMS